jgi:hypothetical protein
VSYYSVDVAGNIETAQTATVKIDWTSPGSFANAPASASSSPISVIWLASDMLSGVASVSLWYKFGTNGIWTDSGLPPQSGNSGTFSFEPDSSGRYCFATQATDWAGNAELAPGGAGDACCDIDIPPVEYYVYLPLMLQKH